MKNRKEPVVLDANETAALEIGLRSEQSERIYTLEESLEFARQRRQTWSKARVRS